MHLIRPVMLGFSMLAFAGAVHADDVKKQNSEAQQGAKPAMSQGGASAGASGQAAQDRQSRTAITATRLLDAKVVDAQGKDLGEISDVVIDLQKNRVHAVVLEFGGFMGVGGKQFAFPMSELKPGESANQFVVSVDKQKLENAQGFAKSEWPGMSDAFWGKVGGQASAGASQPAKGAQQGKFHLMRASKMQGAEVQDKSGKPIGEVRDVVVSLDGGQLRTLVIDVKDAGRASVPAKGLSVGTGDRLVLDMSADQVRARAKNTDRRADRDTGAASGATKK